MPFLQTLLLEKAAVVAFEPLQMSLFKAEQAVNGAIQKITVVGHNDHAALEVLQEILQNTQGAHVKIIGGFIQQQHIRGLDQHPAEGQTPTLSTGQLGQGAVLLGRGEQKPLQQLGCGDLLTANFDAAGSFLDEFDHLALEAFPFGEGSGVLVEVADVNGLTQAQCSGGGLAPTGNQIQQGGFAAAVRPDDADAIFRAEAVTEIAQQRTSFRLAIDRHPHGFRLDHKLADAAADTGHLKGLALLLKWCFAHGLDPLQAGLLLGAAGFGTLPEPGQLPAQNASELGG